MANLIQIKRSLNSASPISLANGELAYTANGDVLFIGSGGSVVAIGGERNPGVLTANQALVANATGFIDTIKVANLEFTSLSANGSYGSNGQVLVTNGSAAYWGTGTSGSNTEVQFNDSGVANASAGFTFNKTSNTLAVGNTLTVNNVFATTQVNSALVSVGTSFIANTTGAYHTGTVNAASHTVGTSTVANSSGVYATTVNAASHTVGSDVVANSSGVFATGTVNAATLSVGSNFKANATQITVGTSVGLSANGTLGSSGQVLHSNGTTIYWANTVADLTEVVAGDGLTGGGDSGSVTLNIGQGNGIAVSADSIRVQQANGIAVDAGGVRVAAGTGLTVNATGVHIGQPVETTSSVTFQDLTVNGNTILGSNSSDVVSINAGVSTSIVPSANITYDLGSNLVRWKNVYTSHVEATTGEFAGNLSVGGDLIVTGNLTTVNVSSLSVSDPLIKLAVNNSLSDTLYIGFAGHYNGSGNTTNHAGLIRNPSDKDFYLFATYGDETAVANNTVDTSDPSFSLAKLNTYLFSGGLVTNATHVAITGNSSVTVSLVANSLSLSTPLAATSGGTGYNSFTAGDILTAGNTTSLSKLSLGADGYVLQSNGSALVYNTLDGGTF